MASTSKPVNQFKRNCKVLTIRIQVKYKALSNLHPSIEVNLMTHTPDDSSRRRWWVRGCATLGPNDDKHLGKSGINYAAFERKIGRSQSSVRFVYFLCILSVCFQYFTIDN
jgi:hypothetical protein